ncbi:hypothetical protein BRD00_12565 [Halobacteriales archaeon QS_8_69_26]|nr:MAG: hypothetical protein BRD00_12565 [Halobacteriales archaeon QS_8_69_26]
MPRDTSLDDFLDDGDEEDDAPAGEGGSTDPSEGGEANGRDPPDGDTEDAVEGKPQESPGPAGDDGTEVPENDPTDGPGDGKSVSTDGPPVDPSTVDPASPTYGWTPGEGECVECGATVTRLWRGGDGDDPGEGGSGSGRMVCPDCKDW